jgi:hypothetical protein
VDQIRDLVFGIGPPGDAEFPIDWSDVRTLNDVTNRLMAVAAFLDETQKQ